MKLLISGKGAVVGMYNDHLLPLVERLGDPTVKRVSNVEWQDGQWVATDPATSCPIAHAPTRREALLKEHEVVESRLASYA